MDINRFDKAREWLVETIGLDNIIIIMSGAIGGVIALLHRKGIKGKEAVARVFVGAVTAVFSTILANHVIDNLSVGMNAFVGFVTGLIGLELTGGIIKIAEKARDEGWEVLKNWLSKK